MNSTKLAELLEHARKLLGFDCAYAVSDLGYCSPTSPAAIGLEVKRWVEDRSTSTGYHQEISVVRTLRDLRCFAEA